MAANPTWFLYPLTQPCLMEQENNEDIINNDDISPQTDESNELDLSSLTEADFYKEQSRREKAEKALVELKKQLKATKQTSSGEIDIKSVIKEELEQEKFFAKNEEALDYKDKILDYKSKGLSLEEAYLLASRSDREITDNRAYSESNISGRQASTENIALLSVTDFDKLNTASQQEYMTTCRLKKGKVMFK